MNQLKNLPVIVLTLVQERYNHATATYNWEDVGQVGITPDTIRMWKSEAVEADGFYPTSIQTTRWGTLMVREPFDVVTALVKSRGTSTALPSKAASLVIPDDDAESEVPKAGDEATTPSTGTGSESNGTTIGSSESGPTNDATSAASPDVHAESSTQQTQPDPLVAGGGAENATAGGPDSSNPKSNGALSSQEATQSISQSKPLILKDLDSGKEFKAKVLEGSRPDAWRSVGRSDIIRVVDADDLYQVHNVAESDYVAAGLPLPGNL